MTYALIVYAVAMTAWYARTLYCIRRAASPLAGGY